MVNLLFGAGLGIVSLGVLLVVVGLVLLVRAILGVKIYLSEYAPPGGVLNPMADLVDKLTKLIEKIGVPQGVPLAVMILGILLIIVGVGLMSVSGVGV